MEIEKFKISVNWNKSVIEYLITPALYDTQIIYLIGKEKQFKIYPYEVYIHKIEWKHLQTNELKLPAELIQKIGEEIQSHEA